MTKDGLKALADELRNTPPGALSQLSDAQLHGLAAAIRDARHRQADELAAAGERALSHIPRLLRAPVRRVVG